MKIAIYPGSFDPITNGHLDILKRSLLVFDKVIILVAHHESKKPNFSPLERKEMIEAALKELHIENVEVDVFDGLTVEYAKSHHATCLIRGLRAVSDFEYEFQLASANEFAAHDIDMVFFMARNETSFISSSTILELYHHGVDISPLVSSSVLTYLNNKK